MLTNGPHVGSTAVAAAVAEPCRRLFGGMVQPPRKMEQLLRADKSANFGNMIIVLLRLDAVPVAAASMRPFRVSSWGGADGTNPTGCCAELPLVRRLQHAPPSPHPQPPRLQPPPAPGDRWERTSTSRAADWRAFWWRASSKPSAPAPASDAWC